MEHPPQRGKNGPAPERVSEAEPSLTGRKAGKKAFLIQAYACIAEIPITRRLRTEWSDFWRAFQRKDDYGRQGEEIDWFNRAGICERQHGALAFLDCGTVGIYRHERTGGIADIERDETGFMIIGRTHNGQGRTHRSKEHCQK